MFGSMVAIMTQLFIQDKQNHVSVVLHMTNEMPPTIQAPEKAAALAVGFVF